MAKYRITPSSKAIIQLPISIGHKAEKGVEAIEFDVTAWVETYGSGTLTVIMRRWGDAIPYPIALEIDENNKATWTLSDIDTAKAGMAYAQLSYIVGDNVVKKSDIYTFRVMDSLTGEGEPPEAYESWLEHLTHFAAEAMAEVLDIEGIVTDKTLTVDGGIADAKKTGDELSALKADLDDLQEGGYVANQQKISEKINDWLVAHPEATTTVQDGSLIEEKFSNSLKLKTIKDYVTPQMFGAVGDGITDDTTAFQTATNTGLPVLLSGNYLLNGEVHVKSDLIGFSGSKILHRNNVWIVTANVSIRNVIFDGGFSCGIVRVYADNITVSECKFVNIGDIAINTKCVSLCVGESSTHFKGIVVENCFFGDIKAVYSVGTRQLIVDRADCVVIGCYFCGTSDYNEGDNVFVRTDMQTTNLVYPFTGAKYKARYSNVIVVNNTFALSNKSAIKNQCSGTIISNNTINIDTSDPDTMHSAIRTMGSESVAITNNHINHVNGNITNGITAEYCVNCLVSENVIYTRSYMDNMFKGLNNVGISLANNMCMTTSVVKFLYGCDNDGQIVDNTYISSINSQVADIYLFDESFNNNQSPVGALALCVKNNVFKCINGIRRFYLVFRQSVNVIIDNNKMIGTFAGESLSTGVSHAIYNFFLIHEDYNTVIINREGVDTKKGIIINISQGSDTRTNLISCTVTDSKIANLSIYNCNKIEMSRCNISSFDQSPIEVHEDATIKFIDCVMNLIGGFVVLNSTSPDIYVIGCSFSDKTNADYIFYGNQSYDTAKVRWGKNNISNLANIDYAINAGSIKAYSFDNGAQCFDTTNNKNLIYYNGVWY